MRLFYPLSSQRSCGLESKRAMLALCLLVLGLQVQRLHSQSAGTCEESQVYPASLKRDGTFVPNHDNLISCKRYCLGKDDCMSIDFDFSRTQCYEHLAATASGPLETEQPCCIHVVVRCADAATTTTTTTATPTPTASTTPATTPTPTPSTSPATTPTPTTTTTTPTPESEVYPDGGCPDSLEKVEGKYHPNGLPAADVDNLEACKEWCVRIGYCKAINFLQSTTTCEYVRELLPATSLVDDTDAVFVQKTECSPPLVCWTHASGDMTGLEAVTDPTTGNITCDGFCFVKLTMGSPSVIERGCESDTSTLLVECSVSQDLQTTTCYCDTNRCNGLSVDALAAQLAYYPLDSDLSDHSGQDRSATAATGYIAPTITCTDAAVNCSAFFAGSSCAAVTSLTDFNFGHTDLSGNFLSGVSFAAWFRRLNDPTSTTEEGIIGNSDESGVAPTWQIIGDADKNTVSAGVITDNPLAEDIQDFPGAPATVDEWHLAVLTYFPGLEVPSIISIPSDTEFYLDGTPQRGNNFADGGDIKLNGEPVTIGCVEGKNFIGYIDEVRIFGVPLKQHDVDALKAMRLA